MAADYEPDEYTSCTWNLFHLYSPCRFFFFAFLTCGTSSSLTLLGLPPPHTAANAEYMLQTSWNVQLKSARAVDLERKHMCGVSREGRSMHEILKASFCRLLHTLHPCVSYIYAQRILEISPSLHLFLQYICYCHYSCLWLSSASIAWWYVKMNAQRHAVAG